MEMEEKQIQAAAKIIDAIMDLMKEDESFERFVMDNTTEFIHVLANSVPCLIFNKLTGSELNILEFNHEANRLCFQYANKED